MGGKQEDLQSGACGLIIAAAFAALAFLGENPRVALFLIGGGLVVIVLIFFGRPIVVIAAIAASIYSLNLVGMIVEIDSFEIHILCVLLAIFLVPTFLVLEKRGRVPLVVLLVFVFVLQLLGIGGLSVAGAILSALVWLSAALVIYFAGKSGYWW